MKGPGEIGGGGLVKACIRVQVRSGEDFLRCRWELGSFFRARISNQSEVFDLDFRVRNAGLEKVYRAELEVSEVNSKNSIGKQCKKKGKARSLEALRCWRYERVVSRDFW